MACVIYASVSSERDGAKNSPSGPRKVVSLSHTVAPPTQEPAGPDAASVLEQSGSCSGFDDSATIASYARSCCPISPRDDPHPTTRGSSLAPLLLRRPLCAPRHEELRLFTMLACSQSEASRVMPCIRLSSLSPWPTVVVSDPDVLLLLSRGLSDVEAHCRHRRTACV